MKAYLRKYKWMNILLASCMLCTTIVAKEGPEKLHSKGTLLMEADSRRVLYENHGDDKMPMASTTKIMTCLLALEMGNLDDVVTASKRASRAPKVKLFLQEGEKQTLGDLLYSLMMESHNDSAVAIAEHLAGSVESFCELMTEKAKELGAVNTSFETPNGLDGEKHYSTPYDMALITSYAIDNPKFIEITNTLDKHIPSKPLEGSKPHDLINKNRFIREYPGAIGVKTGYTSKAGHCFVGAADRDDMQLIAVALGAGCDKAAKTRKYTDVKKMITYGYNNYKEYQVAESGAEMGQVNVANGKTEELQVYMKEDIVLPLTEEETKQVELKITLPESVEAPVDQEQVMGKVEVVCGEEILKTTDLYAKNSVEKATLWDKVKKFFEKI